MSNEKVKRLVPSLARLCNELTRTDQVIKRALCFRLISIKDEAPHYPPLSAFLRDEYLSKLMFNKLIDKVIRQELVG